ncbi:hypothetical protein BZG36_03071 [Bifiguratus adelaidae]|uniref:D-arabinono-1,4-lactone oxidase n=1 Tax=Bifiguratus adelaidae TaxID=1938954 RepID=A0A261XZT0_9FUNG|nr:hypothetical protein BZG36_03071 [Bifiguratus adelaidae]
MATHGDVDPSLRPFAYRNRKIQNWAKTFQSAPELYFEPRNEEEVYKILESARRTGKTVRVVGSGHSPSDLALTNDYMVNLDKMARVLNVDKDRHQITVEAGMRLHELHQVLKDNGMALSNLGSISEQSVAGLISTATHGTGIKFSSLSTMVVSITLLTSTMRTITCSDTEYPEYFHAAQCSLGALGVITRITLQCEPFFRLEAIQTPSKLDPILDRFDQIVHSAEHVRIWWFPHTQNCVVWKANRTTNPVDHQTDSWTRDTLVGFHLYQFALNLSRFAPSTIPYLTRLIYNVVHKPLRRVVDDSYKIFNFDCLFPQYVNEWAIPYEKAPEALGRLDTFIQESNLRVHFPVEIRFVDADENVWLSPSYGRKTCYIGVIMYRPYHNPVPYKKYWAGYEDIMRSLGGRPHWAKAHSQTPEQLAKVYPKLHDFMRIRKELDPSGMFWNQYLHRHLGSIDKTYQISSKL